MTAVDACSEALQLADRDGRCAGVRGAVRAGGDETAAEMILERWRDGSGIYPGLFREPAGGCGAPNRSC